MALIILTFLSCLLSVVIVQATEPQLNNRPILGVLLLENNERTQQFIGASYVKYLESAGARVVPIFLKQDAAYYQKMVSNLNGILMPGGGNSITKSDFARAADHLIESSIAANLNGTYFPIWGTCLSFQKLIAYFDGNSQNWMSYCDIENISLNLDVADKMGKESRIFNENEDSAQIIKILKENRLTANYHKWCLNVTQYTNNVNISSNFLAVSTNIFKSNHFVSTIEHRKYPFYGSAWHPEKNQFEFIVNALKGNLSHNSNAVLVSQFFANFLVNEARKNVNHFKDNLEEANHLFYNYNAYRVYTGRDEESATFEEEYQFPLHFSGLGNGTHQLQTAWSVGLLFALLALGKALVPALTHLV